MRIPKKKKIKHHYLSAVNIYIHTKIKYVPGIIGPICSERTVGPRAQSLLTGSHETEMKNPMSSSESIYEAAAAPMISL